jgi:rare lipoprotein A
MLKCPPYLLEQTKRACRAELERQSARAYLKWFFIVTAIILASLAILILFVGIVNAQPCPALTGTASYYTYESCKREGTSGVYTASQEKFNENDYTAAMWGVPFGAIFKVTNLNNGASVQVRINDRGPAKRLVKKGRIIDLSKAAFMAIADIRKGVIQVKIVRLK